MNHISKSSLMARSECPYQWYCDRTLKLPRKESLGAIVGGAFHEVQKAFQEVKMHGEAPTAEWCLTLGQKILGAKIAGAKRLVASEQQEKDAATDLNGLLTVFHPYAKAINAAAVEREFEIVIPGTDWTVYGFIDLIEKAEEKHIVSDYKTTGVSPFKDDPKDKEGTDQRRLNYVSEVMWNPEVAAYVLGYRVLYKQEEAEFRYYNVIKTKTPKVMPVSMKVTDKQITWFLNLAVDMIKDLENGIHVRRPSCTWCSPTGCAFWNHCHGIVEESVGTGQFQVV